MGQCNHCVLEQAKKRCKKGEVISVFDGQKDGILPAVGKDVYRHPKEVTINPLSDLDREKYWIMWLWELPERCAC